MEPITGHVCRSCRLRLTASRPLRAFSTSTAKRVVPPESPYYVDIPQSFQAYSPYYPQPKGSLPDPREIFPANKPQKSTAEYIEQVSKDALPKNVKPIAELSKEGKHKARMSALRKEQIRQGLAGLQARKKTDLDTMNNRSNAKQRERAQLLTQAEREDARLTNTSVPTTMKPKKGGHSEEVPLSVLEAELQLAKQIHATKLANYQAQQSAKEAMKMDALHTLYMNAREFITTEGQMNRLIKEQFDETKKRFESDVSGGDSLWNLGPPDSIKDMIADAANRPRQGGRNSALNAEMLGSLSASQRFASSIRGDAGRVQKDQERLKRIAEKLSGGKI